MTFNDTEFMSVKEKIKVASRWQMFLKALLKDFGSDATRKQFTKPLYQHLHLHCGFIAHYDIHGFYATYFTNPYDLGNFIHEAKRGLSFQYPEDYRDINKVMLATLEEFRPGLERIVAEVGKELDLNHAEMLAKPHGYKLVKEEE